MGGWLDLVEIWLTRPASRAGAGAWLCLAICDSSGGSKYQCINTIYVRVININSTVCNYDISKNSKIQYHVKQK